MSDSVSTKPASSLNPTCLSDLSEFDKQFENVNELFSALNYNPLVNMAVTSNMITAYLKVFCQIEPYLKTLFSEIESGSITEAAAQHKLDCKIEDVLKLINTQHRIDSTAVKYYKPAKKPTDPPPSKTDGTNLPMIAVSFTEQYENHKKIKAEKDTIDEKATGSRGSAREPDSQSVRFQTETVT